jgi:hypothetical protein
LAAWPPGQKPPTSDRTPQSPPTLAAIPQGKDILCQIYSDGSNVVQILPFLDEIKHAAHQSEHVNAVVGRQSFLHSLDRMTPDRAIERLQVYEHELHSIQSRFCRTRNEFHIADGDKGRLQQIVIELRDLFSDLLGQNTYSSMVVTAYNEGVTNFFNSPSLNSVERILGVVSAALTRIRENPSILTATTSPQEPYAIASQKSLQLPDLVTLHWLYKHVPYSLWAWLVGLLIATFAIGVTAAIKLTLVQQWFGVLCGQLD